MTLSCEDKVAILDNPLDQENPEYTPPQVTFVSPSPQESEIVESSEVNFQWHGYMVDEYRTKFDDGEWQDWTEETSATFQYLDEGPHIFSDLSIFFLLKIWLRFSKHYTLMIIV